MQSPVSAVSHDRFRPETTGHFPFCMHLPHPQVAPSLYRGGLSASQKRRAVGMLITNLDGNMRLSEIASLCGLSVSHFARSFKTSFGVPVHRWVVAQRVERAKALLLHSEHTLLEIALQSGFSDQPAFNRSFAKAHGTSPGRWRKANRVGRSEPSAMENDCIYKDVRRVEL